MRVDILIPSCKDSDDATVIKQINEVKKTRRTIGEIVFTGLKACASKNRNEACQHSIENNTELVIMMDDDMGGFADGWDERLIEPLLKNKDFVISQALLMNRDGTYQNNVSGTIKPDEPYPVIANREICTATFATWTIILEQIMLSEVHPLETNKPFDENYIGSGWEDNDISFAYNMLLPEKRFVVNNTCPLIHYNEMKNQHTGQNFTTNKQYFCEKWGVQR